MTYQQMLEYIIGEAPIVSNKTIRRLSDMAIIPTDLANTDYQTFKIQINDESAQLEDADGNLMTAEQAKTFVATLP